MNFYKNDFENRALDGEYVLTPFLDFEEQKEILGIDKSRLEIIFNGGYEDSERKRAIIKLKDGYDLTLEDFEIVIYKFKSNPKLPAFNHRNILGTLMSLGIKRNTFGDIIIDNKNFEYYLISSKTIGKYLIETFNNVNNQNIELEIIDNLNCLEVEEVEKNINVPSLRLDAIISSALNISRNEACKIIETGMVRINHNECLNIDKKININDMLSIRKYGRITIKEIVKTTRKDRLVIKIGVKH